jgi:hypothetical protein
MVDELTIEEDLEAATSGLIETLFQIVPGMSEENCVLAKVVFLALVKSLLNKIFDASFACVTHGQKY